MQKLRLDLEELEVVSFETARGGETRGTVAAHEATAGEYTCRYHCTFQGPTCFNQC